MKIKDKYIGVLAVLGIILLLLLGTYGGFWLYRQQNPNIAQMVGNLAQKDLKDGDRICLENLKSINKDDLVISNNGTTSLIGIVTGTENQEIQAKTNSESNTIQVANEKSSSDITYKIDSGYSAIVRTDGKTIIIPNKDIKYSMKYKINNGLDQFNCFIGI